MHYFIMDFPVGQHFGTKLKRRDAGVRFPHVKSIDIQDRLVRIYQHILELHRKASCVCGEQVTWQGQ